MTILRFRGVFAALLAVGLLAGLPALAGADVPTTLQNCAEGVPDPPSGMENWESNPTPGFATSGGCPEGLTITADDATGYGQEGGWELVGARQGFSVEAISFKVEDGTPSAGVDFAWTPCGGCGSMLLLSDLPRDASDRVTIISPGWSIGSRVYAVCNDPGGCGAGASITFSDFRFEVVDDGPPWVGGGIADRSVNEAGDQVVWTNDASEPVDLYFGDDGFGIASALFGMADSEGDSQILWSSTSECRENEIFFTTDICPAAIEHAEDIDTAELDEDVYEVGAVATGYDGEMGTPGSVKVGVDRTSPLPPTGLAVTAQANEHGWSKYPSVALAWDPPPEQDAATAPIKEPEYDLSRPGQSPAILGTTQLDMTSSPTVNIPTEGEWEFGVRFSDEAGNPGERAFETIGYDTNTPIGPNLNPIGWVSRDELVAGHEATWQPATQLPALESGVCGYGFSVDKNPFASAPTREDVLPPATSVQLPVRSAGAHHAHLNALSCAGVVSISDTETFRVDSAAPVFPGAVIPAGWSRVAPTFVLHADDFDGAGEEGSGVESISWELSSGTNGVSIGDSAIVTPSDADTSVTFTATDAVGNMSSPQTLGFQLDTVAPGVVASYDDGTNPRGVNVRVTDSGSGVAKAWLESRVAGGTWKPASDRVDAPGPAASGWSTSFLIPDADLPAGDYDFQVVALDAAGNRGSDQLTPVRLPVRAGITLSAAIADVNKGKVNRGGAAKSVVRTYGAKLALVGQALTEEGDPLANTTLAVSAVEPYAASATELTVTTDSEGRFTKTLRDGASRTFTVRYGGSATQLPVEATARLRVRPGITLRPSSRTAHGGDVTSFSGRLLGSADRVPPGGKEMNLQYLTDAGWENTGKTALIDEDGRFKIVRRPWPKSGKRSSVWFRVYVGKGEFWPFAPGGSAPVKIRLLP